METASSLSRNDLRHHTSSRTCESTIPYRSLSLYYLATAGILRFVLFLEFGLQEEVSVVHLPLVLLAGIAQDLLALMYFYFPVSLFALLPSRILYQRWTSRFAAGTVFVVLFAMLFLSVAEYLFFDEFNSRFNLVAVDYFAYPTEVLGNIWESYPVTAVVLGGFFLATVSISFVWPSLQLFFLSPRTWRSRLGSCALHGALCLAFLKFGSIDFLTNFSNRVESQISKNGVLTFFHSAWTNNIEFDHFYTTMSSPRAFQIMREILSHKGGSFVSPDPTNLTRRFEANPGGLGKLNVVLIGEESLGAQYLGSLGDKRNLTPELDRLGREGLLFENAFATGTRTVRGLEALTMSFPPIPSESTVKRPGNEGMANLGQVLNGLGYSSIFLYGGFGAFDNMNYFFGNNGFETSDRLDIKNAKFSNIWGVCDEDLFAHAISRFDRLQAAGKPFFGFVMTTSNHKPYTFPPGIPGIPESGGGREAGVKYADYALGRFFEAAKSHDWFSNTLFVVVGDHDSRVYGKAQIPVERYRVALLILAPKYLAPRRVPHVTSHIDVLPTVMGLLGLPYEGPFYGRDMLDPSAPMNQPVLLNHNHKVGLYFDNQLAVTGLNRELKTYSYKEDGSTEEIPLNGDMLAELTAYLQTGYESYRDRTFVIRSGN